MNKNVHLNRNMWNSKNVSYRRAKHLLLFKNILIKNRNLITMFDKSKLYLR